MSKYILRIQIDLEVENKDLKEQIKIIDFLSTEFENLSGFQIEYINIGD